MGFYSLFCGIIYNDFMSIPLSLFSSCYVNNQNTREVKKIKNGDVINVYGLKLFLVKNIIFVTNTARGCAQI